MYEVGLDPAAHYDLGGLVDLLDGNQAGPYLDGGAGAAGHFQDGGRDASDQMIDS